MKSWYRIAKDLSKVAQIWVYDVDEEEDIHEYNNERTFGSKIKEMYELEYKWSMMRDRPFRGNPRRQENILMQLESNLAEVAEEVGEQVEKTIGKWLETHALLSPSTWAASRVLGEEEAGNDLEAKFNNLMWEYERYASGGPHYYRGRYEESNKARLFDQMLTNAFQNIDDYPSLKSYIEGGYLPDYIEWQKSDATEDLESFNLSHDTEFEDVEQAHDWIDENISIDNIDLDVSVIFGDMEHFVGSLGYWGNEDQVLAELYEHQVFPLWHGHWAAQGIEETRDAVETIYESLQRTNSNDLGNYIAAVNAGLNAAHQTGDMTEYLEGDTDDSGLKEILTNMSEGSFIEKANKELRSVGVQI